MIFSPVTLWAASISRDRGTAVPHPKLKASSLTALCWGIPCLLIPALGKHLQMQVHKAVWNVGISF
jgi:hypothetical protein